MSKQIWKRIVKNRNSGITLIALVVTIIVLLILAGISIGMLSGDNSIIKQTGNAKTLADEAQEKEILGQTIVVAMQKNKYGNVEKTYLDDELNKYPEVDGTKEVDEGIEVTFKSNRVYLVNTNGDISEVTIADRTGISIGDYITYTSPTESVTFNEEETGSSQYASTPATLVAKTLFRVMDIDRYGNMKLLGEISSENPGIYFFGEKGYNNAVYTLDTKCNELYGNPSLKITAQSIKLEDITDKFSSTGNSKLSNCVSTGVENLSIGTNVKGKDTTNNLVTYIQGYSYYPDIYKHQEGSGIDIYSESESKYTGNVYEKGDEDSNGEKIIGESDKYYSALTSNTGKKADINLTVKNTYYNTSHTADDFDNKYGDTAKLKDMFFGAQTTYWLSSRCVACKDVWAEFCLRYVMGSGFGALYLINSRAYQYGSYGFAVRPVVTIPASVQVTIGSNPTAGTSEGAHTVVIP